MRSLHLDIFRVPRRARLELIRRLLVRRVQRSPHLPPQAAALARFVLGELAGDVVEFGAGAEFEKGFFFLGVFLALMRWKEGWELVDRFVDRLIIQ